MPLYIAASVDLDPPGGILQNSRLRFPFIAPLTTHTFFVVRHVSCERRSSLPTGPLQMSRTPFLVLRSLETLAPASCIYMVPLKLMCALSGPMLGYSHLTHFAPHALPIDVRP